jgi:hypothetical protein
MTNLFKNFFILGELMHLFRTTLSIGLLLTSGLIPSLGQTDDGQPRNAGQQMEQPRKNHFLPQNSRKKLYDYLSRKGLLSKKSEFKEKGTSGYSIIGNPNLNNRKFHGWWRLATIGASFGMNVGGPFEALQDQYIYIDTTVYPVQITTTYGTDKYPRLLPDALDPLPFPFPPLTGVPTGNSYFYEGADQLVNGYNAPLKGPVNDVVSWNSSNTVKLLDDKTISVYSYLNYHYVGGFDDGSLNIYKKMDQPPQDTSGLDWNDPVNLFNYYVSANSLSNNSSNPHTGETNFVGREEAEKIKQQFLNGTFTRTTPIRKIRVTNTTYYPEIGIPNDTWTTLYTGDPVTNEGIFSFATPGSTVTIAGGTGALAILNGTYPNGVALINAGADLLLNPEFVDKGPNGSYNDLFYSFLLNLDTTSLQAMADPATGWIQLSPGMTVTVNHAVSSASTYSEFCASCAAWFYATFHTGTHTGRFIYTLPGSARIINTFAELQTALATGTANSAFADFQRYGQAPTNKYYHNIYFEDNDTNILQNLVNCPNPIYMSNPIFNYDVVLGNYLTNVQNLVFTIRGTLEADQPDPVATFGYPYINDPTAGRAHWEGLVVPATVVDGQIVPNVPANYASLGDWGSDYGNQNAYFFGQINPALTGGKVIGYLYRKDCVFIDPLNFMVYDGGLYAPELPNSSKNPRIFREGLSAVYSKMMQWFNSIGCEAIIIDQAGNEGGTTDLLSISEFMGTNRQAYYQYSVSKDPEKGLLNYLHSDTVGEAAGAYTCTSAHLYVSLNEKLYPGSVFKGSSKQKKRVAFITDPFAFSCGDISPNLFLGNKNDGELGDNTQFRVVGCPDGREFYYISNPNNFPVNTNPASASKNLVDSFGNPVSPFIFSLDFGAAFFRYSDKKLSMLQQNRGIKPVATPIRGTSGSAALPISFEETLFRDFGYQPMNRPFIPGWTTLHPAAPNPADPTTWPFLFLDAAILHLTQEIECRELGEEALEELSLIETEEVASF